MTGLLQVQSIDRSNIVEYFALLRCYYVFNDPLYVIAGVVLLWIHAALQRGAVLHLRGHRGLGRHHVRAQDLQKRQDRLV